MNIRSNRDAQFPASAIAAVRTLRSLRLNDGTNASVAVLEMRKGDKLAQLRIEAADGRALHVRLGPVYARILLYALAAAITELNDVEMDPDPMADSLLTLAARARRSRSFPPKGGLR